MASACLVISKDGHFYGSARRYENDARYKDLRYEDIGAIGRPDKMFKLEKIVSYLSHLMGTHIGVFNDNCTKPGTYNQYDGPVILYFASLRHPTKINVRITDNV